MTNSNSLLRLRLYPSGDFSIGANHAPKPDKSRSATEFHQDTYREFFTVKTFTEIVTNNNLISQELRRKFPGSLSEPKLTALFNAYEKEFIEASASGNHVLAQHAIDKIERLTSPRQPMGLSDASNSHKKSRRRGLGGITPFGKRMIRSAVTLIERKYRREHLSFGTATLPPLTEAESATICHLWPEIVRRFFQEICRGLERYGLTPEYAQVTEIQSNRFKNLGFMGLHLHWVMPGKKPGRKWAFSPQEIRDLWGRILSSYLGREVNCDTATRVEIPRKSLHAEIGKYLTKGADILKAAIAAGKSDMLPRAWWGTSKELKQNVKCEIVFTAGRGVYWFDKNLKQLRDEGKIWFVDIYIEKDERECRVGAVGRFNDLSECRRILDEILQLDKPSVFS